MPVDESLTNSPRPGRRTGTAKFLLPLAFVCVIGSLLAARAQGDTEPSSSPHALLRSMTDFMAEQNTVSFHVESNFERADFGQKLQFAGAADIQIRRPDGLAIDYRDDLSVRRVWYDGKQLTLVDPVKKMYVSTEAPGTIDDTLDQFEEKYGLVMPITDLLGDDAYRLIASRALRASYVGLNDVDGEACHHLAFVGENVDLQLWILDGDRPAPCKLVVDYKQRLGRPEYIAVMMDWEFDVELPDEVFQASIPDGWQKIEFLQIKEDRQ
jgi:hypothetical protein